MNERYDELMRGGWKQTQKKKYKQSFAMCLPGKQDICHAQTQL